jgi:hypothetical protein
MGKRMKKARSVAVALLLLAPGMALAGHGKAGLWNVTTTVKMADMPEMSPQVMAMLKQHGMKVPGSGGPISTQVCMTQADVDSDAPPNVSNRDMQCKTHIIKKTASSVAADMTCSGRMQGTGHLQVAYSGAEHYAGSYRFNGTMEGRPQEMSSSFRGDWVRADCGAVKPVSHRSQ